MSRIELTIDEWLQYGIDNGYCSDAVCVTHEGLPLTEEEEKEWDDGWDPCSPGVRLWLNDIQRSIEDNTALELENYIKELN